MVNTGSNQRAQLRQPYDFDVVKPLSPLAEACLNGDISFDYAVHLFIVSIIKAAHTKNSGVIAEAARQLGIRRTTMQECLKRSGVTPHRMRACEPGKQSEALESEILDAGIEKALSAVLEAIHPKS